MASAAAAQSGQPSSAPSSSSSPAQDGAAASQPPATPLNLPISIDKIREQLLHPPAQPLRGLNEQPVFKVEIQEKQKFRDLIADMLKSLDTGPQVPGGIYAYEQQQQVWSKQQHPEMQPYGAFSQGQLATILTEEFFEKYYAGRLVNAVQNGAHARAEEAARREVQQALADFWSYQAEQAVQQQSEPPKP